jgi:hypothetical protein
MSLAIADSVCTSKVSEAVNKKMNARMQALAAPVEKIDVKKIKLLND